MTDLATTTTQGGTLSLPGCAMPFHRNVGPGHGELVINDYVTPHFKGGLRQVDAMRAETDRGEALQLVD